MSAVSQKAVVSLLRLALSRVNANSIEFGLYVSKSVLSHDMVIPAVTKPMKAAAKNFNFIVFLQACLFLQSYIIYFLVAKKKVKNMLSSLFSSSDYLFLILFFNFVFLFIYCIC